MCSSSRCTVSPCQVTLNIVSGRMFRRSVQYEPGESSSYKRRPRSSSSSSRTLDSANNMQSDRTAHHNRIKGFLVVVMGLADLRHVPKLSKLPQPKPTLNQNHVQSKDHTILDAASFQCSRCHLIKNNETIAEASILHTDSSSSGIVRKLCFISCCTGCCRTIQILC